METFLGLIAAALGGGGLGFFLKFLIERRKAELVDDESRATRKRSDFDRALEVVTVQRDDALSLVREVREELENMKMEVQGLRLARDLDPFPNWIIGLDGKYLYVNREFEKQFLEPQGKTYRAVIGEAHETLWPDSFCRVLRQLDSVARRVPDGHAKARTSLLIGDLERGITVHKFPIRIRDTVVGFAGYITEIEAPEEVIA